MLRPYRTTNAIGEGVATMRSPFATPVRRPADFRDRHEAGATLGANLARYVDRSDLIVLALPRGGVPVAAAVADALQAPMDVYLVRKLGVPGHEEFAFGALAADGTIVLNREVVAALGLRRDVMES